MAFGEWKLIRIYPIVKKIFMIFFLKILLVSVPFLDLSGSNDGSVRLWEWGVGQPLFVPRTAGQYAKVTRTRFNIQGNKVK